MLDNKFKLYGNVPKPLLDFENQLKKELSKVRMDLYYEQNSSRPDKQLLSELIDQRIVLGTRLDSLHRVFSEKYPKYKSLKYQNQKITTDNVRKALNPGEQLITYFLGDSALYTFSFTKERVHFTKENRVSEVRKAIDRLKSALLKRDPIEKPVRQLSGYLLNKHLDSGKKTLVFIPDNKLSYIPFEILEDANQKMLLQNHQISYSGSSRMFLELKNDFFQYRFNRYWIGFSPEYTEDRELSSTRGEVELIQKITGGEAFTGSEATKKNYLNNNKDHAILHLAMHAEIDNENPLFNRLVFADGDLTASEIYVSENRANLAVLSACNTGFGKLEKGEGVMSMARAFHFSGVPAVLMSLWKVPDKETRKIMLYFYENLEKGYPKNRALQEAKLTYLSETDDSFLRHPYYWSGFVLNGNTDALSSGKSTMIYWLLGDVLLVIVIGGILKFKK